MATTPTVPPAIGWAEGTHEKTRGVYRTENVRLKNACKAAAKLLGAYSWFDGDGHVYHSAEPLPTGVSGIEGDLPSYWRSLRDALEAAGVLTVEGRYEPLPLVGDAVFLVVQYQDYTRVGAASANSYTYGVWKTVARFEVLQNTNSYGFADGKALDVYYDQARRTTVRILRDVVPVVDRESYLSGGYTLFSSQTVIGQIAPFSVPVIDDGWAVIGDLEDNPTPDFGVRESLLVIPTGYPGLKGDQGEKGEPGGGSIVRTEFTAGRELLIWYSNGTFDNLGQVFGVGVNPPPPPPPPPPTPPQAVYGSVPYGQDAFAVVVPVADVDLNEYWIPAPVRFVVSDADTGGTVPVSVSQSQAVADLYVYDINYIAYEIYTLWDTLGDASSLPYRALLVRLSDGLVLAKTEQYDTRLSNEPYFTKVAYEDVGAGKGDLLLLGSGWALPADWSNLPGYLLWRGSTAGDVVGVFAGDVGAALSSSSVVVAAPDAELSVDVGVAFFPLPPL
jgi:hypothetical protein